MLLLACLIFLAPLVGFSILAIFHNRIPRHGDWLATGIMGGCFGMALMIFLGAVGAEDNSFLVHWTFHWLPVSPTKAIDGGVLVDGLTAIMLVVVTLVSFLVHLFSIKYLEDDVRYGRYFASLQLFTMSMLGLVLADNLLFLFIFWELVGLSSYVLIGHWYEKKSASDAAIKAFITTRVGDVGMLLGMLICYWKVGSLQYVDLFAAVGALDMFDSSQDAVFGLDWQTLAGLGLFLGAMGKSAQFPFHVWLPDAMEGPTPVSALIHAATMVAAGVYMVGRLFPFFTPDAFIFIAYTGAITALFAASIACVQDDIKKVLAYSTLSQLGYMILALGVGGYFAGLYHLTTHAFFKAGLFLGSGSVIYAMHHEQSMAKYGGLWKKLPITGTTYLICVLAIAGAPYILAGFYSKDEILYATQNFYLQNPAHLFLPFSAFFTAILTAFYMMRQFLLTFMGEPRDKEAYEHAHESPWQMTVPLIVLASLAFLAGLPLKDTFPGILPAHDGSQIVQQYSDYHASDGLLGPVATHAMDTGAIVVHAETPHGEGHGEEHPANYMSHGQVAMWSMVVFILGIGWALALYYPLSGGRTAVDPRMAVRPIRALHTLLWNKYYFDEIYWYGLVETTHWLTRAMAWFDKYVIDMIVNLVGWSGKWIALFTGFGLDNWGVDGAVNGVAFGTAKLGDVLSFTQTGRVRQYLLFIAIGVIALTAILMTLI